ncbi:MAG: class I SAM-dependent methyltransferase [Gammaproteobacteria bacterium]|nr:class I SAM-dependent methyltransferase [Gammaproteobacteria bacterium]
MGELKDKARQYATAFDGASPLADEDNRARKAAKIRSVLVDEGVFENPNIRILDIGCSFGFILKLLTPDTGLGVGIDIDKNIGSHSGNIYFVRTDAEKLPFSDGSFDVVICNHVYEHTDDAACLLSEIERIMSSDGVCYFAGPNKYELIEPHYGLPFLSWLPRRIADRYMRLSGKGASYPEKPYSPSQVRNLLSGFEVVSYTEKILRDPVRYNATDILPVRSLKRMIAIFVLNVAPFFFPGFVYILRKPAQPL